MAKRSVIRKGSKAISEVSAGAGDFVKISEVMNSIFFDDVDNLFFNLIFFHFF